MCVHLLQNVISFVLSLTVPYTHRAQSSVLTYRVQWSHYTARAGKIFFSSCYFYGWKFVCDFFFLAIFFWMRASSLLGSRWFSYASGIVVHHQRKPWIHFITYYYNRQPGYILFAGFLFAGRDLLSTTRIRPFNFPTFPNGTFIVRCLRLLQLLLINKTWLRQFGKWTTRNKWQMMALKWEIRRRSTRDDNNRKMSLARGVWRWPWLASRDRKSLNQIFY